MKLTSVLRTFAFLLIASLIAGTTYAQDKIDFHNGREVAANEVLVKFATPRNEPDDSVKQTEDIEVSERIGDGEVHRLRSRSKKVDALIKSLRSRPDVVFVEPNYIVHLFDIPNDPSFPSLWGLRNTTTLGADISAVPAWDISVGSAANVVAVVDTGTDYSHPDISANMWSAPTSFSVSIGGVTITCAAGTHGFNAIIRTCDPADDNNHGTHVTGTVGAVGNNGIGVVGVNRVARIMAVKFLDSTGSGTISDAIDAIEFAIQAKNAFAPTGANVRVLSNSWGGDGFSQALLNEINRANAADMLFVAAAGNSGTNNDTTPAYPASYQANNVIAVAATDINDNRASFSNYGALTVDLGAPGVSILSTIQGNRYGYMSGTSMATPHVSGAAALILSRCSLSTSQLVTNILANVARGPQQSCCQRLSQRADQPKLDGQQQQ
ncbi:MAG: S8 family serine peptidase [Gammaproteobacteria bacterium]|nr:S8 family serine peptidase [Gammaproteobacteria bacterium]